MTKKILLKFVKMIFIILPFLLISYFMTTYFSSKFYFNEEKITFGEKITKGNEAFYLSDDYGREKIVPYKDDDGKIVGRMKQTPIYIFYKPKFFLTDQDIEVSMITKGMQNLEIGLVCTKCEADSRINFVSFSNYKPDKWTISSHVFKNYELKQKTDMKTLEFQVRNTQIAGNLIKESTLADRGLRPIIQVGIYKIFSIPSSRKYNLTSFELKDILKEIIPENTKIGTDSMFGQLIKSVPAGSSLVSINDPNYSYAIIKKTYDETPLMKEINVKTVNNKWEF